VDSLELTEETFSAITDKIPQKPVGVVEGTSYTIIILAAFAVRGPGWLVAAAGRA
jgi:import inner membrane translocase subunit TIM21